MPALPQNGQDGERLIFELEELDAVMGLEKLDIEFIPHLLVWDMRPQGSCGHNSDSSAGTAGMSAAMIANSPYEGDVDVWRF